MACNHFNHGQQEYRLDIFAGRGSLCQPVNIVSSSMKHLRAIERNFPAYGKARTSRIN